MERLRALARGAADVVRKLFDERDLFVFGGLGCATYGVAQISVPAAWIIFGAVLFLLGVRR